LTFYTKPQKETTFLKICFSHCLIVRWNWVFWRYALWILFIQGTLLGWDCSLFIWANRSQRLPQTAGYWILEHQIPSLMPWQCATPWVSEVLWTKARAKSLTWRRSETDYPTKTIPTKKRISTELFIFLTSAIFLGVVTALWRGIEENNIFGCCLEGRICCLKTAHLSKEIIKDNSY